jgi:hypothetical protein
MSFPHLTSFPRSRVGMPTATLCVVPGFARRLSPAGRGKER